jgi:hypothetical protein
VFVALAMQWACEPDPTVGSGPVYTHEEHRFQVAVERPEGGVLRAAVTPRAPWKLAERFPCRLDLLDPEARIEPVAFSEEAATFELPREDRARLEGTLAFALCQGDVCVRVDHPFEASLPATGRP